MTGDKEKKQNGFTLMEILVVLGVFATISVAVADLFMLSSRAERRASALQKTQADARTALGLMTTMIRKSQVAYSEMPMIPNPLGELAIESANGTITKFSKSSDPQKCGSSPAPCLLITSSDQGGSVSAPFTPQGLAVEDLKFYLTPAVDPFYYDPLSGTYAANSQPTVTIALSLIPTGKSEQRIAAQTTVTARTYER